MFAQLMGMELKWLLLLPVYRYCYIGMIANAYSKEQKLGGVDYSVGEVVVSTVCIILVIAYYYYPGTIMKLFVIAIGSMWILMRVLENYTVLKMFTKRPFLLAIVSWIPGVMLWQAITAWRKMR